METVSAPAQHVPFGMGHDDEDQVTEEADDDGRQGGQGFNGHADPFDQVPFVCVFRQVDAGRNAADGTEDQGQEDQVQRVEELVAQAFFREGEHIPRQVAAAFAHDIADEGDQQDDGEIGAEAEERRHDAVEPLFCCKMGIVHYFFSPFSVDRSLM